MMAKRMERQGFSVCWKQHVKNVAILVELNLDIKLMNVKRNNVGQIFLIRHCD